MIQIASLEKYIEHTLLKPDATLSDITKCLDEAVKYSFLCVCFNPVYIQFAKEYLEDNPVKVGAAIGFPLGVTLASVKAYEAERCLEDGADELDMVIDIGAIKDKKYKRAENDIKGVVNVKGGKGDKSGKILKVILETDLLDKSEIIEACKICINAGADFVKTSTGFVKGGVGATVENVKLMYDTVSPYGLGVKASGGIKDRETAIAMIEAGATRIGTSSGVSIIQG